MSDNFLDSLGNVFGIGYTETERKRDSYKRLYEKIDSKKGTANEEVNKASTRFGQYSAYGSPAGTDKVSSAYGTARTNFDEDYNLIKSRMGQELESATSARATAYSKYCYYRDQDND